jgi:hypothetical protein
MGIKIRSISKREILTLFLKKFIGYRKLFKNNKLCIDDFDKIIIPLIVDWSKIKNYPNLPVRLLNFYK